MTFAQHCQPPNGTEFCLSATSLGQRRRRGIAMGTFGKGIVYYTYSSSLLDDAFGF